MPSPTHPLPDYQWAGAELDEVELPDLTWLEALPPVTASELEQDLPPSPAPLLGDLTPIAHPKIRNLAAYWHEEWPHSRPESLARLDVAERLYVVANSLPDGFGLAIWDAWRDFRLQEALYHAYYDQPGLQPGFVSEPDPDAGRCPPHASGGTLDLTLTWKNQPLHLGTAFDAFVPAAAAMALEPDGPTLERNLRRLLAKVMSDAGFVVLHTEWWHWEYGTRLWAAINDEPVRYGRTEPIT